VRLASNYSLLNNRSKSSSTILSLLHQVLSLLTFFLFLACRPCLIVDLEPEFGGCAFRMASLGHKVVTKLGIRNDHNSLLQHSLKINSNRFLRGQVILTNNKKEIEEEAETSIDLVRVLFDLNILNLPLPLLRSSGNMNQEEDGEKRVQEKILLETVKETFELLERESRKHKLFFEIRGSGTQTPVSPTPSESDEGMTSETRIMVKVFEGFRKLLKEENYTELRDGETGKLILHFTSSTSTFFSSPLEIAWNKKRGFSLLLVAIPAT
jgi:hypothetical protein